VIGLGRHSLIQVGSPRIWPVTPFPTLKAACAWSGRLPFETHEKWLEDNRYSNMDDLFEQKTLELRQAAILKAE
jgi:hypothetical protein